MAYAELIPAVRAMRTGKATIAVKEFVPMQELGLMWHTTMTKRMTMQNALEGGFATEKVGNANVSTDTQGMRVDELPAQTTAVDMEHVKPQLNMGINRRPHRTKVRLTSGTTLKG